MRSSNANFDEDGFGNVIRDIEELNLNMSDLGEDAEGQSKNLNVLQGSISGLSTNVQALANRLSGDESSILSLQSAIASIFSLKYGRHNGPGMTVNLPAFPGNTISLSGMIGDGDYATSLTPAGFTAPETGVFWISAQMTAYLYDSAVNAASEASISLYSSQISSFVSGSTSYGRIQAIPSAGTIAIYNNIPLNSSAVLSLSAGSYVTLSGYGTSYSSGAVVQAIINQFSVVRIR